MPKKPKGTSTPINIAPRIEVTEDLVAGFTETFLQDDFDDPRPSPPFHRKMWGLFCCDAPKVAVAAPRGHAKSTAGTLAYGLSSALFGAHDFILIVSATEALAAAHLSNMARVLEENEDLKVEFDVTIVRNNETMLVVRVGSREFCVIGKGAEQKVRGLLWRNKRPSLILVDDLEEDEAVLSPERREKLRNWFFNALIPCGSVKVKVRFVGTILHLDSLLSRLLEDDQWLTAVFRAHKSYDDFSELLWPERITEKTLRAWRAQYKDNPSGYSQEYLNQPVADVDSFFRKSDFRQMEDKDFRSPKVHYASLDFALGRQAGDNTAFAVGGVDPEGILHILEVFAQKMDTVEAVNKMFELQATYDIDTWLVESENIAKAVGPFLQLEMQRRGVYLNLVMIRPDKEKQKRAVPFKARMRSRGVKWPMGAEWFAPLQGEMLNFPRGKRDDQVDALAYIGLHIDKLLPSQTREELEQEMWEAEMRQTGDPSNDGRSSITGY